MGVARIALVMFVLCALSIHVALAAPPFNCDIIDLTVSGDRCCGGSHTETITIINDANFIACMQAQNDCTPNWRVQYDLDYGDGTPVVSWVGYDYAPPVVPPGALTHTWTSATDAIRNVQLTVDYDGIDFCGYDNFDTRVTVNDSLNSIWHEMGTAQNNAWVGPTALNYGQSGSFEYEFDWNGNSVEVGNLRIYDPWGGLRAGPNPVISDSKVTPGFNFIRSLQLGPHVFDEVGTWTVEARYRTHGIVSSSWIIDTLNVVVSPTNCEQAATEGYPCLNPTWDGPVGDGWHCTDLDNICCYEGNTSVFGFCTPPQQCRTIDGGTCDHAPAKNANYLGDVSSAAGFDCVNDGNYGAGSNPYNELACCPTLINVGTGNTVYNYQSVEDVAGPQRARFCGGTAAEFTVLCTQDSGTRDDEFCANRYGTVCATPDPDCCNNGVAEPGEVCDPAIDGPSCTNSCAWAAPTCGDTTLQVGETCEAPVAHDTTMANWLTTNGYCPYGSSLPCGTTVCNNDCTAMVSRTPQWCGDGVWQLAEGEGGDAGANNGDATAQGCNYGDPTCTFVDNTCQWRTLDNDPDGACTGFNCPGKCSDGVNQTGNGEQCDDGNLINSDGCSATCQIETLCGNGVVDVLVGEVCDDSNTVVDRCPGYDVAPGTYGQTYCAADCKSFVYCEHRYCGDGVVDPDVIGGIPVEECDGSPGCTALCTDSTNSLPTLTINSVTPDPVALLNSVTLDFDVWDDNDGLEYDIDWGDGLGFSGVRTPVPNPTTLTRQTLNVNSPGYTSVGAKTIQVRIFDPSNGAVTQSIGLTVDPNPSLCGNGIVDSGEICDTLLHPCCESAGPNRCQQPVAAGPVCDPQEDWACQGSCERERDLAATCDGASFLCPAPVNVVESISTNGEMCFTAPGDDYFAQADGANNLGFTGPFCASVTNAVRNPLGCEVGTFNPVPGTLQIPVSSSSGAENDMCFNGFTGSDMCYYLGADADDNGNALIDSAEGVAICPAACSLADCTAALGVPADSFFCGANPGGAWQTEGALYCPGLGLGSCQCVACPAGSYFNSTQGQCVETACADGIDNDQDGTCDIAGCAGFPTPDADCTAIDVDPVIQSFYAVQDTLDPRTYHFYFNASDDFGLEWTLDLGHAGRYLPGWSSGPAWTPAGTFVSVMGTQSYQYPAVFINRSPVLRVRDVNTGNEVNQTISVSISCVAGDADGETASSAGACCPGNCFNGSSCFENLACDATGSMICHNTSVAYTSSTLKPFTDRDNNSLYQGAVGPSCNANAVWFGTTKDYYCQDNAGFGDVFSDRCDTDGFAQYNAGTRTLQNFICGDDPNEYPTTYTSTAGADVEACLWTNPPSGQCLSVDRNTGLPGIYDGNEVCSTWDVDEDCDGNFTDTDPTCQGSVFGEVRVLLQNGDIIPPGIFPATIEVDVDQDSVTDQTINVAADGSYSETIPPSLGAVTFTARVTLSAGQAVQSITLPQVDPGQVIELNFLAEEIRCTTTCAIAIGPLAGRCDRSCLGQNGCPTWGALSTNERRVFNASHPDGRAVGRREGELVFLAQNATDREVGIACISYQGWEPAPKALLEGEMENLIKYTQLTTLNGRTVRLVIATWN